MTRTEVAELERSADQVHAALRRIGRGHFGICQKCHYEIHPKRLAAVPWTSHCLRCQGFLDGNLEEMHARGGDVLSRAA
jgi:RNA polymerase-binding transcription factor DksA